MHMNHCRSESTHRHRREKIEFKKFKHVPLTRYNVCIFKTNSNAPETGSPEKEEEFFFVQNKNFGPKKNTHIRFFCFLLELLKKK